MRKIEVIFLDPENCRGARTDILIALDNLRYYVDTHKLRNVRGFLSLFRILWKLDMNTLEKYFDKKN